MVARHTVPAWRTARVGEKFGRIGAAFKITIVSVAQLLAPRRKFPQLSWRGGLRSSRFVESP
jgi:hypothetical protein